MSLKSFLLTLFALFTLLHLTMSLPTGPPSNIPSALSSAGMEQRQMGQGYVLQCTVGRSASECQEQFDTYCDANGLVRNGATIAQANGECSSVYRYCYCDLTLNNVWWSGSGLGTWKDKE